MSEPPLQRKNAEVAVLFFGIEWWVATHPICAHKKI